jgi:hypothetical protein
MKYFDKINSILDQFGEYAFGVHVNDPNIIIDWVIRIDPTGGEYAEWILKNVLGMFAKGLTTLNDRFFKEDFYKVTEDLEAYHKYKKLFKKAAQDMNNPNTAKLSDINQIKSFEHLYQALNVIQSYIDKVEEKEQMQSVEKEADKIYTSENYYIIVPKTKEASCAYGKGTRWCTAAKNYNYFERYSSDGPLYIIIDRKKNEKYQFHFQSNQYMNADDSQVNVKEFFDEHNEIKEFIIDLAIKNDNTTFAIAHSPDTVIKNMELMEESKRKDICKKSAYISFRYGLKNPEYVNSVQDLFVFMPDEIQINTDMEWSDMYMFIGSSRRGGERDFALEILKGFFDAHDYVNNSYDERMLDWVNPVNADFIIKYAKSQNSESDIESISDAMEFFEEEGDTEIRDMITRAYNQISSNDLSSKYYERALESIQTVVGSNFTTKNGQITLTKWKENAIQKLFNQWINRSVDGDEESVLPEASPWDFMVYWDRHTDEDDKDIPNFDQLYADPSRKDYGDDFNQFLSDSLSELKFDDNPAQMKLDLSSINRNMTRFDAYIKKLFEESLGDMGPKVGISSPAPTGSSPMASGASQPSNPTGTPSGSVGANTSDALDINDVINDPTTKWKEWLQKPNNSAALNSHVMKNMFDPKADPRVKDDLAQTIDKSPDLKGYYNNLVNTITNPQQ